MDFIWGGLVPSIGLSFCISSSVRMLRVKSLRSYWIFSKVRLWPICQKEAGNESLRSGNKRRPQKTSRCCFEVQDTPSAKFEATAIALSFAVSVPTVCGIEEVALCATNSVFMGSAQGIRLDSEVQPKGRRGEETNLGPISEEYQKETELLNSLSKARKAGSRS